MQNLNDMSGLDLKLDDRKHLLVLGKELTKVRPATRLLKEMKEVLVDKEITVPSELYYMYRSLHKIKDGADIRKNKLRYDVSVIRSDRLGNEFMKTAGHYHPGYFGELYEILSGAAWCLLQKRDDKDHKIIEDVILVKAKTGDKIVIPPKYGHILINVGKRDLVASNWVSSEFSSEYELYKQMQGAAYYIFEDNLGERFEVNPQYKSVPKIKVAVPSNTIEKFGLKSKTPMYPLLYDNVQKLDFLNNPLKYGYSDAFVFL